MSILTKLGVAQLYKIFEIILNPTAAATQGTFRVKARPSRDRIGGIPLSLKLEGQDWQCIFHAFQQGVGKITHAMCGKDFPCLPVPCMKA